MPERDGLRGRTVPRLALAVGGTVVGRHRPVRRVHSMQVRSVALTAVSSTAVSSTAVSRDEVGQEVAADGEVIGRLPARFTVDRYALRVVVPRRS